MQSVDEFTPSTTEPVFGSGLISQTKSQPSTNNDISDNEKVIPPSEPIVNGQNDTTVNKITSNDSITNGTTDTVNENIGAGDSAGIHVNGQNEKSTIQTTESTAVETPNPVEPTVSSTAPKSVSSAPVDTVNEGSSTVDTAPPPIAVEPTTTTAVNDNVPEVPVATESKTTELKSKSPRGKAKAPVVSTTPTRQSARGRKPASSSNVEENQAIDDTDATTTNQNESPQRTKRQAATNATNAITASNQFADDIIDQDVVSSNVHEDDDITEGQTEKASPSAGRKRGAPKSTPNVAKKAKGKNSITSIDDVDNEGGINEDEIIQISPKKARTSAIKKTPEPPSEEYARKLRPRK